MLGEINSIKTSINIKTTPYENTFNFLYASISFDDFQ
ncbi:MAG: hypothetical protein ACJA1P_001274 [Maribacter sp.]